MIASRASSFVVATIGCLVVLAPVRCDAQWWRSAPVDFESCADVAEKASTKEEKTAKLAECNAKFAGRRKPGGGYTYYDFMQDRTFDIAGPNPTPEEQKRIDEQYTAYLERERRNHIAAAMAAKQQQPEPPQAQEYSRSRCAPNRHLLRRLRPKRCRYRWQVQSSRRRASRLPNAPRTNSRVNGRGFQRASTN
ncbi:hypothetical protein ACF1BQ_044490 [Bradyrhizobium sp. RDT10]